jgi:hypothetical protein
MCIIDRLQTPEPTNFVSVQHLQTEVHYTCTMDFPVEFGDIKVLKTFSHKSPASMVPGCTAVLLFPSKNDLFVGGLLERQGRKRIM